MLSMALIASQTLPVIKHCWIDELQAEKSHKSIWHSFYSLICSFTFIVTFRVTLTVDSISKS